MPQYTFPDLNADTSGGEIISSFNAWRDALHSLHSGNTRPSYAVPGMLWVNTSANPWRVMLWTGSTDAEITTVTPAGVVASPIGNNSITLAKLAQIAKGNFLGRVSAGNGNVEALTVAQVKAELGLDNVSNTSDASKPVSTAQAAAIGARQPLTGTLSAVSIGGDLGTVGDRRLDLFGGSGGTGWGSLIRSSGVNGDLTIQNSGSGNIILKPASGSVTINGQGVMLRPNQPRCQASRNQNAFESFTPNTSFGIVGTFHENVGGFYSGGSVGPTGNALHVPATGAYLLVHRTYTATNFDAGRLNVMLNNSTVIAFNHSFSNSSGSYATSAIVQMNAGDYLNYKTDDRAIGAYTARNHTDLFLAFLG